MHRRALRARTRPSLSPNVGISREKGRRSLSEEDGIDLTICCKRRMAVAMDKVMAGGTPANPATLANV
jgi:hypothetical protein